MALSDVKKTGLGIFQDSIKEDIEELLIAFYGDNYKEILAKGRLSGDKKTLNVLTALKKLERDLGIELLKGKNL